MSTTRVRNQNYADSQLSGSFSRIGLAEKDKDETFHDLGLNDVSWVEDLLLEEDLGGKDEEQNEEEFNDDYQVMDQAQLLSTLFPSYSPQVLDAVLQQALNPAQTIEFLLQLNQTSQPKPVCKYFINYGKCYRKDCFFTHDVETLLCNFYVKGECLKQDKCEFSHDIAGFVHKKLQSLIEEQKKEGEKEVIDSTKRVQVDSFEEFPDLFAKKKEKKPIIEFGWNSTASHSTDLTFAEKIKIMKLQNELKWVDKNDIEKSLKTNGWNEKIVIEKLRKAFPKPKEKESIDSPKRGQSNQASVKSFIKTNDNIPWLSTGQDLSKDYHYYRGEAIQLAKERNAYFSRAHEAFTRGQKALAKELSLKAQQINEQMKIYNEIAKEQIFLKRNWEFIKNQSCIIDVHGLHVDEAVEMVEWKLGELKKGGTSEKWLKVITGTGHHSKTGGETNRAKLLPARKFKSISNSLKSARISRLDWGAMVYIITA